LTVLITFEDDSFFCTLDKQHPRRMLSAAESGILVDAQRAVA